MDRNLRGGRPAAAWALPPDLSIVIISERRTARGCSQQGVRFDPDMPQTIRLEFAKSNTKVSKPKPAVATAAPAAHPALMHPLTGRKYRQRTHARRALDVPNTYPHTTTASRPSNGDLKASCTQWKPSRSLFSFIVYQQIKLARNPVTLVCKCILI